MSVFRFVADRCQARKFLSEGDVKKLKIILRVGKRILGAEISGLVVGALMRLPPQGRLIFVP